MTTPALRQLGRLLGLLLLSLLALQLYFLLRIALMALIDPQSTSFQRSEAWRLLSEKGRIEWSQQWVADERIAASLKRAVIASEDAAFTAHGGVEWDAIERAWERNQRAHKPVPSSATNAAAARARPCSRRSSAAPPSPNSWPRTCSCPANARPYVRPRSSC